MSARDEWARGLGNEISAKKNAATEQQKMTAMERDIEAEKMPLLWEDLCVAFQSNCQAYNEQNQPERPLIPHRMGFHKFLVHPDALPDIVEATYHFDTKRISIAIGYELEWFLPKVVLVGSGNLELVSSKTRRSTPIEKIARDAIREGLLSR